MCIRKGVGDGVVALPLVAPHCTLLSPTVSSWSNNAKSVVAGPALPVLTRDDATGARVTIEANAKVMEPAKATSIFLFIVSFLPKGTTLHRLLRHGSHGRRYIACDDNASRKNDVALRLQGVSVLIHGFEPTQRHFLRQMLDKTMLTVVSSSLRTALEASDTRSVHERSGRITPHSAPMLTFATWLTGLSACGTFGQRVSARARGGLVVFKGYTLIEVLVVLVVMGLAAALVAPAFLPRRSDPDGVVGLVRHARAAAIRRAEEISLQIEASGAWRLDAAASLQAGAIATGRISSPPPATLTLVFSPLGSCSPDVESAAAGQALGLDPLTCEAAAR